MSRLSSFLKLGAVFSALFMLQTAALPAQTTYAIRNARIVTVSGPTIENGTVVVSDGKISAVGERVRIPSRSRVINGRGLTVYPGLFNANTQMGLTEVGAVAVTNDYSEMGEFTPHLLAFSAFHVESEHIPVARVDGITHVLTRPSGGTMPGQAAVMHLAGWSPEEMEVDRHAAQILDFPALLPLRGGFFGGGGGSNRPHSEQKKEFDEKIGEIKEILDKARHYARAQQAGAEVEYDKQLAALLPVLRGEQPVLIEASSRVDIKEAVKFAEEQKLNYVILGAREAAKVADFLKEHNARVILGATQALPPSADDPIDIMYRTPAILHEKGVAFALATGGSSDVRTLPFEIGNAVAYGLPYEAALRAITLSPAEFLGVADRLGSIEEGKIANLVVADGDILEYQTQIRHLFINGAEVELESRHTQLYEKYINRP